MAGAGWRRLIPADDIFHGDGAYRIDAYSEYLPPPRIGWKPYGGQSSANDVFANDDPWGWRVSEFEEMQELRPGLLQVGKQLLGKLARLQDGNPDTGLPNLDLGNNLYWPAELAAEHKLPQERGVVLMPLALSRTQDDKGRVRWTLFGGSEQGPAQGFWKSFYSSPKEELPAEVGIGFFCRLLGAVYGEKVSDADELHRAGFRIIADHESDSKLWNCATLPSWTKQFLLADGAPVAKVKYVVTFRPFGQLPKSVRTAYLGGNLCLLPFPGSLAFWGVPGNHQLQRELPFAVQMPLLFNVARHQMPTGLRVPQSGLLHEPSADRPHPPAHGHVRNTFKRTHRWDKILRDADELALIGKEDRMLHVLFSTVPEDIDLYDKPMARNVQLWTENHRLLLDGPRATPAELKRAMKTVEAGGLFGYRFVYPAMRVGNHKVYWHRPLVAYLNGKCEPTVLPDAPLGYLTAYDANRPKLGQPIEFWPRLQNRPLPMAALAMKGHDAPAEIRNVHRLTEAVHFSGGKPVPRNLVRQLLALPHHHALEVWLDSITDKTVAAEVRQLIGADEAAVPGKKGSKVPESLTYGQTARRLFEVAYWKTISALSEGTFLNKNNADCVLDAVTQGMLPYHERHLENLGDFLLAYYDRKIVAARLRGKAMAGEVPFRWRTDFDFSWMGGWRKNQDCDAERDILVMIPGRDRSQAVIMADHYDTAYMVDKFDPDWGGCGARMAACGADDNHSATAAMMLAAPIFLQMSKQGKLGCDVWLVHLTGEEFPADCLGARALTQRLVEGTLKLHMPGGKTKDLSKTTIRGLYVSDMIAHNNDRERDIFQISPGNDAASFRLALHAHIANEIWNASVPVWNESPERKGRPRGRRSPHGGAIPEVAPFLQVSGQVRLASDPRSTLYNTDGQIFSDAGVPCVLFMENYDINRTGYHDTHDTMENIDLDYGSAVCAITIEAVARAANADNRTINNK
jgi:hypothetical protein